MVIVEPRAVGRAAESVVLESSSPFSREKVSRVALRILSLLVAAGAILLGAHVLVGTVSAWHLLTMLALTIVYSHISAKADRIVDLKDPKEVEKLAQKFSHLRIREMLEKYPLETIVRYNLASLDRLRTYCCMDLKDSRLDPILQQNADGLLRYRIITPEVHTALVAGDVPELQRILPGNTLELNRMFEQ